MTNTPRWHPTLATDRAVYHNDTRCLEGAAIAVKNRRPGDGGRPPCALCVGQELPDHPLPPMSGTREHAVCPACQSERSAPVGDILAVGRLIKVTHRCRNCGTLFVLFRRATG